MSAASPTKKEKRSRTSTDVKNSFVKNVTSRVSGLLPSTITKWFSSPSSSNTNGSATIAESSDSSTEDESLEISTQPPAKRMRYAFECECRSPSNNYIRPEMKCTSTNTESIATFSSVQSPVGQSTVKPETQFVSTSLVPPKEETTISEHENNAPVYNLHSPLTSHSIIEKRKSIFGGPVDEKLPQSKSIRDSQPYFKPGLLGSPFYPGKTRYGGAASSYTNQPNIKHRKDKLISNSTNNDSIMVSHVTRRVMDLLENYSSPLIEAKRISQFSRSDINSLDTTIEENAYKTKELYVPKMASILHFKQKAKLMGTTSAARQIIASNSSSPAFKPYPATNSNSNNLKPTSENLMTKIRTRVTKFNRNDRQLNDINTAVQLPPAVLQSENCDLPKFTLEMSVAETSTTSETMFTSTITVAAKSDKAANVITSAGDETEATPTTVIVNNDNVSMNINEIAGKPQKQYSYKFSEPDMILDESIQNSSPPTNYTFVSPERQTSFQLKENENEKENYIGKGKKKENEEYESGKLISIANENKTGMHSGKWKCKNCWVFNDPGSEICICCGSKLLGNSNKDNNQCSECKITLRKENNDKCIECEKKKNNIDKLASNLPVPVSSKWKCEDCWVENDLDVNKCVCCGGKNSNLCCGPNSKSDEWKCEECWIKNKNNFSNCVACGGPKPVSKEITSKDVIPSSSAPNTLTNNDTTFKEIIKSQSEQWECANCLVRNDNKRSKCDCCDAEKPGTYTEAEKNSFNFGSVLNTTFKFGIKPSENIPLKKPESSLMQFEGTVTESETNNNIVPEPLKFNFGIPKPKSSIDITSEEEPIAEDRTPPPEGTFKFGITTISTTANVFSNSPISDSKYTESAPMSNLKEADEKVQEVPDIEGPNSSIPLNAPTPSDFRPIFGLSINNSSAASSMPSLIAFGTAGQSTDKQATNKQAVATTAEDTKVPQSTYSFKPAVNLFSATATTTSISSITFSAAPKNITPTNSFFQTNETTQNQTFFPNSTVSPSTLSMFGKNETMTTTVAAVSNTPLYSFGGNNTNIQTEKHKFNFTFGNKSEVPSLFTSPMSNTNNTLSGNGFNENTVSGTVMSGGNGLATGNSSVGGHGLPLNSLSSGLLAGPAKKDGMWPMNSDLNSFKMTSGTSIETSDNNLSSIQPGSLFVAQQKKENIWPPNQNTSNDSLGALKFPSGNNLEPITDPLGMPAGRLFGAPEKKDSMWSPNNNNSNNMFGTNPSTSNLQKSTSFTFGSSTMQFNGNNVTPPTFGSPLQPPQNIFGMSNQNNNNPTLFSHPIQHQTPPNLFGAQQINNATPIGMFGAPNVSANPSFGTPNQAISTFEAPQLNPVPTPTFNFGAQQTTGVFGFGQQQSPAQSGVYNFGAQPIGSPQRQFNIGTASAPNMVGRRVIRKAVRRTTQR